MTVLVLMLGIWVGISVGLLVGAGAAFWLLDRRAGEELPLSARPLGPHDMPRIHVALSPAGLEAAAFSAGEIRGWEAGRDAPPVRVVEYVPVRVQRPA